MRRQPGGGTGFDALLVAEIARRQFRPVAGTAVARNVPSQYTRGIGTDPRDALQSELEEEGRRRLALCRPEPLQHEVRAAAAGAVLQAEHRLDHGPLVRDAAERIDARTEERVVQPAEHRPAWRHRPAPRRVELAELVAPVAHPDVEDAAIGRQVAPQRRETRHIGLAHRSEERRVGKQGRYRRTSRQYTEE